jgi:hypothetical protein
MQFGGAFGTSQNMPRLFLNEIMTQFNEVEIETNE